MFAICKWEVSDGQLVGGECFGGEGWAGFAPKEGGGSRLPAEPKEPQHCGDIAGLAPANTDQGALSRLIFQEATGSSRIGMEESQADEVNAISATVQNRSAFLNIVGLTQAQTMGFGSIGASVADVVYTRGKNPNGKT